MENIFVCYPGGRFKALTLSYDDGKTADRRLIEIFNRHGLKGSFHLNAGLFDDPGRIPAGEVASLYAGHEVSCHTLTHPTISRCPPEFLVRQIMEDREGLERIVGYPVRGMSYPNGSWSRQIVQTLPNLGIEYARMVQTTGNFNQPASFLEWQGTCHHKQDLLKRTEEFIALFKSQYLYLMYVWGHSYEFDLDGNWDLIEQFAEMAGGRDDIWYATNIELVDYQRRWESLKFSADCSIVANPSALGVWISVGSSIHEIPGGKTVRL